LSDPKQKKNASAFFDCRAGARGAILFFEIGFQQSNFLGVFLQVNYPGG
jgi:hypothetical protein